MIHLSRSVALAAVVLLASGCAANGAAGGSQWTAGDGPLPPQQAQTMVAVQNNNWADMVVYAVRYSHRVRLGMVTSMNSRRFTVPSGINVASGPIELMAEAIGSRDRFATGPIDVHQGQRVELKIENQLPISSWSVW